MGMLSFPLGVSLPGLQFMPRLTCSIFMLLLGGTVLAAEPIRYQRDIRPILASNCFKCHGPDLKKSGLDLQGFESATKALPSGSFAVAPWCRERSRPRALGALESLTPPTARAAQ